MGTVFIKGRLGLCLSCMLGLTCILSLDFLRDATVLTEYVFLL